MTAKTLVQMPMLGQALILIAVALTTSQEVDGNDNYKLIRGTTGVITSPNYPYRYPNSIDYYWDIETTPYHRIELVFETFELEFGCNCGIDYVEIYDGFTQPNNTNLLGRYCDSEIPPSVVSSDNKMGIKFHSNWMVQMKGFKATYRTDAGFKFIRVTTTGVITSPYYPNLYSNYTDFYWDLKNTPNHRIKLVFETFELETSSDCRDDYVEVYDGYTKTNAPLLGRFCGYEIPPSIMSTGNRMGIIFHSDENLQMKGFKAIYMSDDYHQFIAGATAGIITSPNYPNPYSEETNKYWDIKTTPNERIKLVFETFELESGSNCENDYVEIYDSFTQTNDSLLGRYCGSEIPPTIISTDNEMSIKFHSDGVVQEKGFKAIYMTDFRIRHISGIGATERNLTQYYLRKTRRQTRSINKWGRHVSRTAVVLFLSDEQFFARGNRTGEEIAYELSLQWFLKKTIPTNDLALFINALIVACMDPKDFFGINMVDELRKRVNNSNNTNPFSILTLCNANDTMTTHDVLKLQQQFDAHFRPIWTDTQAMVVMALSCISSRSDVSLDKSILDEMVSELKKKQLKNGTIDNLKTTALVVQALLAAGSERFDFDLEGAVNFILQEVRRTYPNIEEIYYILPIFNSKSLANVNSDHCEISIETDNLQEHPDERISVQISVFIGNDVYLSRTWKVKVSSNSSLYQVLENIGTLEPAYKVQYSVSEGKPYIVGLSKFQDDTLDGFFWFIYTKPLSSSSSPKLIQGSPVDIPVKETDEFILWYRSGSWETAQDDSSDDATD